MYLDNICIPPSPAFLKNKNMHTRECWRLLKNRNKSASLALKIKAASSHSLLYPTAEFSSALFTHNPGTMSLYVARTDYHKPCCETVYAT